MTPGAVRSEETDVDAVLARIHAQRLRWLSVREARVAADDVSSQGGAFPRSRTLRFVLAHRRSLVLGLAAVLLLRRGWSGGLGMMLLRRFADR